MTGDISEDDPNRAKEITDLIKFDWEKDTTKIDFEDLKNPKKENRWESRNAEIAVFDKDGEIVSAGEHDDVIGWLTPNEVAKAIEIVSGYQGQTMTGMTGEKYIKDTFKKYSIK